MPRVIIVGAGIVGVCTAYFLAEHAGYDPKTTEIVILEAVRPACAASGKAGGLLSSTAFPAQIVPLSFDLHAQLADKFNGSDAWGYRRLTTIYIEGSKATKEPAKLPEDLDWVDNKLISYTQVLGGPDSYAQVHPYLFTTFLLRKVTERGAVQLINGRVVGIHAKDGKAQGVSYVDESGNLEKLTGDHIIVTAGPWVQKLLPECPIVGLKAHSITLQPTRQVSAYALFTELQLGRYRYVSPEIYARKDEIFVSGEGAPDPLPETADKVTVDSEKCDALFRDAGEISQQISGGRVIRKQACFLPVVDTRLCPGPFIGNTNIDNLLMGAGHSCWGINNAPATGKLLAEIVFDGKVSSADISGLEPRDFFEASLTEM